MIEKKTLTVDDIDSLVALELPRRETPALVVVTCLAVCIGEIRLSVADVNVAAEICAQVVNIAVLGQNFFECKIRQQ
jgi:hypothetical protein